ncbi:MAG TPA: hypothetical protein VGC40_04980 [Paenirhodobacter sp.]
MEAGNGREIEDVLASIRRLVSQDSGHAQRASVVLTPAPTVVPVPSIPLPTASSPTVVEETQIKPEAEAPEDNAFLLLTPAQRIEEAPQAVVPTAPVSVPLSVIVSKPQADDNTDLVDELRRLESSIAEMEASVSSANAELRVAAAPMALERVVANVVSIAPVEIAVFKAPEIESPVHDEISDETMVEAITTGTAPEIETAIETAPSDQDDAVTSILAILPGDTAVDTEIPDDEAQSLPELETMTAADAPVEAEVKTALTDDIVVESLVGMPRFAIHRGGSNADMRAPFEDIDEDAEDTQAQPDTLPLDQEALRLLVAKLIREELQGVLGQKITQNVRKLVRREIQRSLIGTEFE